MGVGRRVAGAVRVVGAAELAASSLAPHLIAAHAAGTDVRVTAVDDLEAAVRGADAAADLAFERLSP